MSLNIKNPATHALVRELAELTGTTQTSAVDEAVRRMIREVRALQDGDELRKQRVQKLLQDFQTYLAEDEAGKAAEDDLYDAEGLYA
jgi:antitoxin VapB